MKHKVTQSDFNYFKAECGEWLGYFGLTDWYVDFEMDEPADEDTSATTYANLSNRVALISLSKTWPVKPTNKALSRVAFHEACEVLLTRLRELASARMCSEEAIRNEIHAIIRRLENTIWLDIAEPAKFRPYEGKE